MSDQSNDLLLPDRKVRERYDVSQMTMWRWDHDPELDFPKPVVIKKRKYRRLSELEAWERCRAAGRSQSHSNEAEATA